MVELLAPAIAGVWLYLTFGRGRFWQTAPLLQPPPPLPHSASSCRVAVIIPARNEAATISSAVHSLLNQDWPGKLVVFVADDGSDDGTGELATKAGAQVVTARPLPPGWSGKVWALSEGLSRAQEIQPDFCLFTDADILHEHSSVSGLVARAEAGKFDLVSYMVRLHCETMAERFLIPAFVYFFLMVYPPAWISERRGRTAGAAGGCILLRPEVLRRAGGLDVIRGELIDDCSLAKAIKDARGSVWLGMSDRTCSLRIYESFTDVRRMISRTAFTQLGYSGVLLAGTVLAMSLVFVLPTLFALYGDLYGIAACMLMVLSFLPVARFYKQSPAMGLLLPTMASFYLAATVESAWRYWRGRGGTWKGRHQATTIRQS